jgi:hypothetical protein
VIQEYVTHFTHELHAYLLSGAKLNLGADKAPAAAKQAAPAGAR